MLCLNICVAKKIGFIIDSGKSSPFISDKKYIAGALNSLEKPGYEVQIIQGTAVEQLCDNSIVYDLKGLIWFGPPPNAEPIFERIHDEVKIPLVIIKNYHPEGGPDHYASVCNDPAHNLYKQGCYMLEKGHKSILYIGYYGLAEEAGICDLFTKAGMPFSKDFCLPEIEEKTTKLVRMIKKWNITGVISTGGKPLMKSLFEQLSKLPVQLQPEVLVPNFLHVKELSKRNPKVKICQGIKEENINLGIEAAKMLVNHLDKNEPLKSIKFKIGVAYETE